MNNDTYDKALRAEATVDIYETARGNNVVLRKALLSIFDLCQDDRIPASHIPDMVSSLVEDALIAVDPRTP